MANRLFLPARRGDETLVFEHREVAEKRRWEFVAVARVPDGNSCVRTGNGPLTPDELAACAEVAAKLPALQAATLGVTLFDLNALDTALDLPADLAIVEGSSLLTLTLYLQLLRDTLVTAASVARYQARPVAARVSPGLSSSLYVVLLKEGNGARAAALVDQDMDAVPDQVPRSRDWGYFFAQAAGALQTQDRAAEALALLQRAVLSWPTEAAWRKIGGLHEGLGQRPEAIKAFEAAEKLTPLSGHATLRRARWLAAEGRPEEARGVAKLAQTRGAEQATAFLQRLPEAK